MGFEKLYGGERIVGEGAKRAAPPIAVGSADAALIVNKRGYSPAGKQVCVKAILLTAIGSRTVNENYCRMSAAPARYVERAGESYITASETEVVLTIRTTRRYEN
jgi:hypothetical protein